MPSVLVIEDNIENLELAVCLLKIKGYKIEVAMDGEKALELADRYNFNLILLDIWLPKIDGFEVLRKLKNTLNSNTPVVIVTACILNGDEEQFLASRCAYYLEKPFTMNKFHEVISIYISDSNLVDGQI
jgi:CheY-like chemotaxis protein